MKKSTFLLLLIIAVLIAYIFYVRMKFSYVQDFIDRVEGMPFTDTLSSLESKIASVEKTMNDVKNYNEYLDKIEILPTDFISIAKANDFHKNYMDNRKQPTVDTSRGVLFEFPKVIKLMTDAFGGSFWNTPGYWDNKGFIIYFSNYGTSGDMNAKNKQQTSAIFQIAIKQPAISDTTWTVQPPTANASNLLNFGGLKPPAVDIIGEVITKP